MNRRHIIYFALFVFTSVIQGAERAALTFHVSPNGSDANAGTGPEDAKALRTIQTAVNRMSPGDICFIRGGVYRETIIFPRSGEAGKPITLAAYRDEKPVVSGCEPVTGWTRHRDNIYKAPMTWTLGTGRNQVFVDKEVYIEARHPNVPEKGYEMYVADLSPLWPSFAEFSIVDPKSNAGRIVSKLLEGQPDDHWKGALYYGVHFEGWAAQTGVIEGSKSGEIIVGDRTKGWWFGPIYGGNYKPEEGRGMIVGHMNALDMPGEWHWQDNTLYLIPKGNGPTDAPLPSGVEAKKRQLAFDLSGREHIHIKGIRIKAASMNLQDSAYCVIDGCQFAYISHFLRQYSVGQIENGRDTIRSGETGIFIGGHDNSFLNTSVRFSAGAGFHIRGYHHTIHNCLIDEVSYTAHYLNAITDAVSDFADYENMLIGGHVITYNTMRNAGRHFFNINGNGTSTASRTRGPMDYMATLFAHNHLYNGMLQTKDAGFITGYFTSGGTLNGLRSQVIHNVMHDCYDTFGMRINVLGIVYLDQGSCNIDLHHNLLWAAPGSHQRGLWYNTACVDISEHDNPFYSNFTRTSSELNAGDFPGAKPFRFGHDHTEPPMLPPWPPVTRVLGDIRTAAHSSGISENDGRLTGLTDGAWFSIDGVNGDSLRSIVMRLAGDVKEMNTDKSMRASPRHQKATDPLVLETARSGGAPHYNEAHRDIKTQWTFVYSVKSGSWLKYERVPLGEGYRRFRVVYGKDRETPGRLRLHLDATNGPLVCEVKLAKTDVHRGNFVQIYSEALGDVSEAAAGVHDVYVVFEAEDGKVVGDFEYFRFEQYRGSIALAKNEVKIEVRTGSKDGEKIGDIYPRYTGGNGQFRDFVAPLARVQGRQTLYFVVRSAITASAAVIDRVSFETALMPQTIAGIGIPPRMEGGKMIFPEPTHTPQSKPNEKYAKASSSAGAPRMIIGAREGRSPVIDGRIDEWFSDTRGMLSMQESYDRSPASAPSSTAWVRFDDEALYIAAKHPVKNVSQLAAGHAWGKNDGMEVAFQDAFSAKPGPVITLYGFPDGTFESSENAGAPADVVERMQKAVVFMPHTGSDSWSCEWRIPFSACGFSPKTAPHILFNLGVRKTDPADWVILRGTGGATFKVENGTELYFASARTLAAALPKPDVWLDADDGSTIIADEAGKVSAWNDKSGNARHAVQKNPSYRPLFETNGCNGLPALRFSEEATTRLELPDLSDQKITATIFAVVSNPEKGLAVNRQARIFTASDGKGYDYQVGLALHIPEMTTGGPRIISAAFSDRWAKMVRIGCFSPNFQTFFKGSIAEILVYRRALALDEANKVRAYLSLKWGLHQ